MNTENLQQIIDHYLDRFEELNGPEHAEYYKWQIAFRFRDMMDEALSADNDTFPSKLYEVRELTENLIDSYTLPFTGLVEFSKREPETVRGMFQDLFATSEAEIKEKQKAIDAFLSKSNQLRERFFPDSFLYKDDLHSVTAYLFLYDPNHNYLYKATHCRDFADCIGFYDDWGSGADTKLNVFYRMCDEALDAIKKNEPLMTAAAERYDIDPNGMHPDTEKHILLFDLIYCCSAYHLFNGIRYDVPKSGERKLLQERKEKAKELSGQLEDAKRNMDLLNASKTWLNDNLQPGTQIRHRIFGDGTVQKIKKDSFIVLFPKAGEKSLGTVTCVANELIQFEDGSIQSELAEHLDILKNSDQAINAVQRAEKALIPYMEYLD